MKIARRISTQEYVNDFQDNATSEVLTVNAISAGIPENDIEIVDVTPEEYATIKESILAPLRTAVEQEWQLSQSQMVTILKAVLVTKLGLTIAQAKLFLRAMKQVTEDDLV